MIIPNACEGCGQSVLRGQHGGCMPKSDTKTLVHRPTTMKQDYWDPDTIKCHTCETVMTRMCSYSYYYYLLWCSNCGTVLTADRNEALSDGSWSVPEVADKWFELPDLERD